VCVFAQVLSRSKQCQQFFPLHKSNPSLCALLMTYSTDMLMSYPNICVHVCPSHLLQEQDGEIRAHFDDITGKLNGASHESAGLSCHGNLYSSSWIPIYGFLAGMSAPPPPQTTHTYMCAHASQLQKMTHHCSDAPRLFLLLGKRHAY